MPKNNRMQRGQRGANRQINQRTGPGDVLVKRMTVQGGVIASSAGNVIVTNTSSTAALVQSDPATEWASFAARYQQFRVRSVRLIMDPVFPASGTPAVAGLGHCSLYIGDFIGASVPGSAAAVLADESAVIQSTAKRVDYTVTWDRNPNAKLWNPTASALPTANSYGIAFASNAVAATLVASTNYYSVQYEWIVEFRGSQ